MDKVQMSAFSEADVLAAVNMELAQIKKDIQPVAAPVAVLLAGQPGAGKTMLSTMFIGFLQNSAVFVNADDYRRYHPNYRPLHETYGSDSVQLTADFSSAVTNLMIQELSSLRVNLVIEGTGRTTKVPLETAELLSQAGYTVEMAVIAARPEMSLASTLLRFYQMNEKGTIPRATAIDSHDITVAALPQNLDVLNSNKHISRISIWDREQALIFDSCASPDFPSSALKSYWLRPWSAQELDYMHAQIHNLWEQEEAYHLKQSETIRELEQRVAAISARPDIVSDS